MENPNLAENYLTQKQTGSKKFRDEDKIALTHIKYAQGLGASLRMANELRAVQQVGRLPFLKSSNLHEDVLRGPHLGQLKSEDEETGGMNRMSYQL